MTANVRTTNSRSASESTSAAMVPTTATPANGSSTTGNATATEAYGSPTATTTTTAADVRNGHTEVLATKPESRKASKRNYDEVSATAEASEPEIHDWRRPIGSGPDGYASLPTTDQRLRGTTELRTVAAAGADAPGPVDQIRGELVSRLCLALRSRPPPHQTSDQ